MEVRAMRRWFNRRAGLALLASAALVVGVAGPAAASDVEFPAGLACDFALGVDIGDGGPQNGHEFTDKEGTVVGVLVAGRGNDLTFTNLATGAGLTTKATGSVTKTAIHPDGSLTVTAMGGTALFLFPSDTPPGPSTTVYIGRVVYDVDPLGNYTIVSVAGRHIDICAALTD
jgi:hypothetical protein